MKWINAIYIIDSMNLSSVDLNLLVVFEALYETGNVTLAGKLLNRAQPSVSNALGRLRLLFQDELFVRTAGGMVATEKAQTLIPAIAAILDQLRDTLERDTAFNPEQANGRRFTLAASDYADIVPVPHIVRRLRRLAPGIDLRLCTLDRERIYTQLDNAQVDIAIGGHLTPPKRMQAVPLYSEDFVCISDRATLAAGPPGGAPAPLTLQTYLQRPHALFVPSNDGSRRGVIDRKLAALGLRRRVAATFSHIVALPQAVSGTDLIATLAGRVDHRLLTEPLHILALPTELTDTAFSIDMVSGRDDSASRWLRQQPLLAVRQMQAEEAGPG
ncbi:LysR family transcriptional regulator [Candidatus Sodalis endolongispinus]|uniref:LysR family transcriptional regulator n=1 Tax=Candidatus Sodalis endolongispinus TaxID=2812662 RepID=A0ABS5Y8D4_9GAMM|nr:LysR family transcriptional regulator [Candidatus Sodalis endolongispinus]MBT9431243.1 LysR family transcriptional regulator [Candidatus Sodalis endolongispinus]